MSIRICVLSYLGFAVFALSACTSVPLTSIPKVTSIDLMTMDPADMDVAIRLNEGLALENDAVALTFVLLNKITGEELGDVFPLTPLDAPLTAFLEKKATKGRSILRYRLSDAQAAQIRDARAAAIAWPKPEPDTGDSRSMSFSVDAKPCLTEGTNPFQEHRFSIYLRADPSGDFFTLINNAEMKLDDGPLKLERCGGYEE